MSKNDKIYPKEGEPWTGISEEELLEKGFKKGEGLHSYVHPKLPRMIIVRLYDGRDYRKEWSISILRGMNDSPLAPDTIIVRDVKYMYQIDNMFHGFTDRWLGYI